MSAKKSVYDILLARGICSNESIQKAKDYEESFNCTVIKALVNNKCLEVDTALKVVSSFYRMKAIRSLERLEVDFDVVNKFTNDSILDMAFVPFKYDNNSIHVGIVNPSNSIVVEDYIKNVYKNSDLEIEYYVILEDDFEKWTVKNNIIRAGDNIENIIESIDIVASNNDDDGEYNTDNNYSDSILIKAVNKIFVEAHSKGASDIHIEPLENKLRIRFRIDGILVEQLLTDNSMYRQLVNRVKIMSDMDVNNYKTPQSGKIRIVSNNRKIDMRVSTLPSIYGEKITIRLLSNSDDALTLEQIFYDKVVLKKLRGLLAKPNGIILATGPTGSGKSSTLFAGLNEVNSIEKCIVTIEDPVEYRLPGAIQVSINHDVGLDFSAVLRETLRQDPDIIMIGEIRDIETAKIAVSASNTGHLVLSTLHTNDASSTIVRLTEMGVEPFMISSALMGVLNQRLVRTPCKHCKELVQLEMESPFRKLLPKEIRNQELEVYRAKGCEECNNTGYKGRLCLMELLVVDDNIREAIVQGKSALEIKHIAIDNGMTTIKQDAVNKVVQGLTTFEEIHRALHFEEL